MLLREGPRRRAKNYHGIAESDEVAVNLPANSFTQGNHGRQRTERGRFGLITSRESRGRQERFRSGAWPNTTSVADSRTGSLGMFTGMYELRAGLASEPKPTSLSLRGAGGRKAGGRVALGHHVGWAGMQRFSLMIAVRTLPARVRLQQRRATLQAGLSRR